MRLDAARLCLDCEEVHEDQVCPVCSSEAFAYLTRWVQPAAARVGGPPAHEPPSSAPQPRTREQLDAYRQLLEGKPPRGKGGLVTTGAIGLAALGLAGWAWRASGKSRGHTSIRPDRDGDDEV